jgi:hypothetical protein
MEKQMASDGPFALNYLQFICKIRRVMDLPVLQS